MAIRSGNKLDLLGRTLVTGHFESRESPPPVADPIGVVNP